MKLARIMIAGVAMLLSVSALAATAVSIGSTGTNSSQSQQTPAGKFIQDLGNRAIAVIADKSLMPSQRSQKYSDILRNSFDMPTIGHFVLGRAWSTATPEQRQEFMKLFQQIVLKTYGDRLSFYSGEGFRVTGTRQENDMDTIVNSEVIHTSGSPPTKVDWRVHQENGKLAVIDVDIEGVSQSVTQRQEYAAIIQRDNGDINGLLDLMRQRSRGSQQGATLQENR